MNDFLEFSEYRLTKKDNTKLSQETKKSTIPRKNFSRTSWIYGLPKIHKPNKPFRSIVSAFRSPTQNLTRYLAKEFQLIIEISSSRQEVLTFHSGSFKSRVSLH